MEAIKCPNCGSEKVKELTEEKYVCLGCDNIFLVHNLSKEFRRTDAHIADVHADISKKIDEIKGVAGTSDKMMLKRLVANAETLLEEDLLEAYKAFREYAMIEPESAVGYEGMFRAITDDYTEDAALYVDASDIDIEDPDLYDVLYDGFDVLIKALKCKDVDREKLLDNVLTSYKYSAKHLSYKSFFEEDEDDEDDEEFNPSEAYENVCEAITKMENEIKQCDKEMQENVKALKEYENLTKEEKRKKFLISKIPAVVLFIIGLMIGGGFLRIIFFIGAVLCLLCLLVVGNKPIDESERLQNAIEGNNEVINLLVKVKKKIEDIDILTIDDMEKMIYENYTKGDTAEEVYVQLCEAEEERLEEERLEEERQAEIAEGYFSVSVHNWGRNRIQVRDIMCNNCADKRYVNECYRKKSVCTINGFRKSEAYQLQEKLMKWGAVAIVRHI